MGHHTFNIHILSFFNKKQTENIDSNQYNFFFTLEYLFY